MSSRLLTMKFMQRGSPSSTPNSTPSRSAPATPADGPPAKRQRLSNGTASSASVVQKALEEEERKRQEALDRLANEAGETKWVLSFAEPARRTNGAVNDAGLRVVQAGFGDIDAAPNYESDEEEEKSKQVSGRWRFGGFGEKKDEKRQGEDDSEDDSEDDDERDEDRQGHGRDSDQYGNAGRTLRMGPKKASAKKQALDQAAYSRRQKEINLNSPKSISAGGASRTPAKGPITCHACGGEGHIKAKCPNKHRG
ncbi:hypothetical protein LTS18_014067 [Coniosporium uncinatum]|uniref:Uncharacterized protein n=1 Tax=Coniosporium uncinatum TaxID=93489 RepID=A0ACC3DHL8_9PEZI|nr:hypothetical protein LTS18_014067 [Coniosporium uncinatum]